MKCHVTFVHLAIAENFIVFFPPVFHWCSSNRLANMLSADWMKYSWPSDNETVATFPMITIGFGSYRAYARGYEVTAGFIVRNKIDIFVMIVAIIFNVRKIKSKLKWPQQRRMYITFFFNIAHSSCRSWQTIASTAYQYESVAQSI